MVFPHLHAVAALRGYLAVVQDDGQDGHRQEGGHHRRRRELEGPLENWPGQAAGLSLQGHIEVMGGLNEGGTGGRERCVRHLPLESFIA